MVSLIRDKLDKELSKEDPTKLFELLDQLGKGSFGCVYRARRCAAHICSYLIIRYATAELVAIKLIPIEATDECAEDIRKEIMTLKDCDHPNIVKYYGTYFKDDHLWIVMEYCGGGSVSDICQTLEHGLTEQQIAVVIRETLKV